VYLRHTTKARQVSKDMLPFADMPQFNETTLIGGNKSVRRYGFAHSWRIIYQQPFDLAISYGLEMFRPRHQSPNHARTAPGR